MFTGKARKIFCPIVRNNESMTEKGKKLPDFSQESFALDNVPIGNLPIQDGLHALFIFESVTYHLTVKYGSLL